MKTADRYGDDIVQHYFEDALELDAEIIELSDSLYRATEFYVVRDSILVVVNDATSGVPYVEFYRMGYFDDRIAGYFLKGNGPLEMLSVNTYLSEKHWMWLI